MTFHPSSWNPPGLQECCRIQNTTSPWLYIFYILYILYIRTLSELKSKLHVPHLCRKISFRCKFPEVIIFRNQKRYSIIRTSWLQATSTCSPLHFPPHPLELQLQMAKTKLYRQKYMLAAFFQTTTKSGFFGFILPRRIPFPRCLVFVCFCSFSSINEEKLQPQHRIMNISLHCSILTFQHLRLLFLLLGLFSFWLLSMTEKQNPHCWAVSYLH